MRNNPHTEFSMKKPVLGLMAVGILIVFLTSFINGSGIPDGSRPSGEGQAKSEALAEVPALMAKLQENPKDMDALMELAESFSRAQDWDKAALFWGKIVDLKPEDVNALNHRGAALMQAGRYHDAIADFEKILSANPKTYHALYHIGIIYKYGLKENEKAKEYLQRALDANPQDQNLLKAIQQELATL